MIESSATVGNATAQEQVATTQFFTDISQRIGIGVELVRGAGYGLLSLLLEVSALGMISLVREVIPPKNNRLQK